MPTKRSYGEGCAAAHALDLVGERWALLVVRELLLGPKRFTDLRAGLSHASANVLAQRLRDLERDGIVQRRRLGPPFSTAVYELTEWGRELEPVIMALGRWGSRSPQLAREADISVDSLVLAVRALFDPDAAGDLAAVYELHVDEDRFSITIDRSHLDIARGEAREPDAVIDTDTSTLRKLLMRAETPRAATKHGRLTVTGDVHAVECLLGVLRVPELAAAP